MKLIDTIEFTPKTSVMYNVDRMWTEMLLRTQERHINDFMRKHGYTVVFAIMKNNYISFLIRPLISSTEAALGLPGAQASA